MKDSVSVETASQEIVWDPEVPQTVSSSGLVTLIALAMAKKAKVEMRVLVNIYASVTGASILSPMRDHSLIAREIRTYSRWFESVKSVGGSVCTVVGVGEKYQMKVYGPEIKRICVRGQLFSGTAYTHTGCLLWTLYIS